MTRQNNSINRKNKITGNLSYSVIFKIKFHVKQFSFASLTVSFKLPQIYHHIPRTVCNLLCVEFTKHINYQSTYKV